MQKYKLCLALNYNYLFMTNEDLNLDYILDKYWDIIKEEINVKEITWFWEGMKITKIFKPLGSSLSEKFGKDTWNIIKFWKIWNIEELWDWKVRVFDSKLSGEINEWILEKWDYEIAYEGLNWDDIAIDGDVIARLDLELTPELIKEGMAREISRFINQMRKEADYQVDTKVAMCFDTQDEYMRDVINSFKEFLITEALLLSIQEAKDDWDIRSIFNLDDKTVTFTLKQ